MTEAGNRFKPFEFATADRIVFGPGEVKRIGELGQQFGTRAFVVTGKTVERAQPVVEALRGAGLQVETFGIGGEPSIDAVEKATARAKEARSDFVVSSGGGSAIDAGKAVAGLVRNPGELIDYLEVIGGGKSLQNDPLPSIAVPTTAGTGAEVTKNAVLASPEHR